MEICAGDCKKADGTKDKYDGGFFTSSLSPLSFISGQYGVKPNKVPFDFRKYFLLYHVIFDGMLNGRDHCVSWMIMKIEFNKQGINNRHQKLSQTALDTHHLPQQGIQI